MEFCKNAVSNAFRYMQIRPTFDKWSLYHCRIQDCPEAENEALTLWSWNYFFLILAHPVYKM